MQDPLTDIFDGTATGFGTPEQRRRWREDRSPRVIREFQGGHRFLSNFFPAPVTGVDGRLWPTVEHAYQALKTTDRDHQERIRALPTPGQAKRAGRTVALRSDFSQLRLGLMERLVTSKFTQHPDLGRLLVATGDALIQEGNRWGDTYWGVDLRTGQGANNMGEILMRLRTNLYFHEANDG